MEISVAHRLIEKCLKTQDKVLDLAVCGLNESSAELDLLRKCTHVEKLRLGNDLENVKSASSQKEHNSFTRIPEQIKYLQNLKYLSIEYNQIKKIENLESLQKLQELFLSNNQISNIEGVSQLTDLQTLILSSNPISKIEGLDTLTNLKNLHLSGAKISKITGLDTLTNLQHLNLDYNQIPKIEGLANLTALRTLGLGANKISKIENIDQLLSIETLTLSNNRIKIIEGLSTLESLSSLFLNNNSIEDIFELEELLPRLSLIYLHSNPIKLERHNIEEIKSYLSRFHKSFKKIKIESNRKTGALDLSNCALKEIPNEVKEMKWLNSLILNDNKLEKIEKLETLSELTVLKLFKNRIAKIENLDKLTKLKYLTLRENNITEIEGIDRLKKLTRLNLSNNKITSILPLKSFLERGMSISINHSYSSNDTGIFVADNPLGNPPAEIVKQGNESILNYFMLLEAGTKSPEYRNKYFKIILVGNSESGKSEFVKQFINKKKENSNSTHYLEIEEWDGRALKRKFPAATKLANDATAFVYDFGGQEYYHDTHKIYFTNKTIYLLFWENRTNNFVQQKSIRKGSEEMIQHYPLTYWLESISFLLKNKMEKGENNLLAEDGTAMFAEDNTPIMLESERESIKNAPVLVIENKIDLNDNQLSSKLNQFDLERACNHVYEYTSVSLISKNRFSQFKNSIADLINYLNPSDDILPSYYEDIINEIKRYQTAGKEIIVDKIKFIDDCKTYLKKPDIITSDIDRESLLDYLSQKGIIIYISTYFQDNTETKNDDIDKDIIINPELFRKQMHMLFEEVKKQQGIFRKKLLNELNIDETIIKFLQYYKLIFSLSVDEYVAPVYLPTKPIPVVDILLDNLPVPVRRFLFTGYIHKTIIMDTFSRLKEKETLFHYYWRDGLIISKKGITSDKIYIRFVHEEILTQHNKVDCKCYIELYILSGDRNGSFINEIIQLLKSITASWSVTEQVTTNGQDFVSLKILNEKANTGILQIECGKKIINIADLNHFLTNKLKMKKIFISYAEEDNSYREMLDAYLSTLKRQGLVSVWHDRKILAGSNWNDEIQKNIQEADIILCLLTPDYFKESKTYIWDVEIPVICKKILTNTSSVIPIVIKDTPSWHDVPIGKSASNVVIKFGEPNGLPKKSYIKNKIGFPEESDAWAAVSKGIKELIESL